MNLLVLNYEYPPVGGGAGVIARHIAEGLVGHGHKVTVLTTWFAGEEEITQNGDLTVIRVRSRRRLMFRSNPMEMISWIKHALKYMDKAGFAEQFGLCLCHFALPGGEVALRMFRKFRLPYIIISHGHDIPWFFPEQMLFYHLLTYYRIRTICRNASRIVLQSQDMKTNADKFTGSGRSSHNVIIYNGCDTTIFKPDNAKKSEVFKILFVGRLVKQKDPITFLKAVKIFAATHPVFLVHILGDGPLRKKMEDFVKKNGLDTRVRFAGWVDKNRMLDECQSAHLKVSPSLQEGMSVAVLESLACGQYVMTTPVSENSSVITDSVSGEIFNLRDHNEIARRIEIFYNTKFLPGYDVPDKVVEDFRIRFDWNSAVAAYHELIVQVAREAGDHTK